MVRNIWRGLCALRLLHSTSPWCVPPREPPQDAANIKRPAHPHVSTACFPQRGSVLDYAARVGAAAGCHSGLLRCSVNDENMMLKLMLILCSSLALGSTECCW